MIGSLLYLTASKPDIAFSVRVCSGFQAAPKESHLIAVKQIIPYINGMSDYGIWYSRDSNECLAGYSDADWGRCIDDKKSTSSGCFYLGNNLVSWMSKRQNLVSLSMVEAEYIVATSCCAQLFWMKKLLHDYGISQDTMCVFYDNTSAINLSKNPVQHSKSKHIEIRYHLIWDLVEEKTMYLEFITTDNQKVDIFTKPLDDLKFETLRKTIGVSIIPWTLSRVWTFCSLLHTCCIGLMCFCLFMFLTLTFALFFFFGWFSVSCSVFECVQKFKNP